MSLLHQIALTCVPGIGSVTARALLTAFGSAEEVFGAKRVQLLRVPGVGLRTAEAVMKKAGFAAAEREREFIDKYGIRPLFYQDSGYPARLVHCYDAPVLLYYRGTADLNGQRVVSVVGTRSATPYGRELAEQLVQDLARRGVLVVSGLAYGIDILAHKACVAHGVETVAVLGHGLDRIYPATHRPVAGKMIENGGLLSEFPSGTAPDRENFPKRNRIIAGMADATIVIQAGRKGGALITADLANSYNRDVFAFPGNVFEEYSVGCHLLIKSHRAQLLTDIADLDDAMGWGDRSVATASRQTRLPVLLHPDEQQIAELLKGNDPMGIDLLVLRSMLSHSKIVAALLSLEMQGVISSLPGNRYTLA